MLSAVVADNAVRRFVTDRPEFSRSVPTSDTTTVTLKVGISLFLPSLKIFQMLSFNEHIQGRCEHTHTHENEKSTLNRLDVNRHSEVWKENV
jgi:hypothetical protein